MSSNAPSKEISPKLQKNIEKLQARIKSSPDYEVHQELKAVARRYLRVQDYDSAVQLLYIGGELLLDNGLGASGADITISLIEVYNTAHMKPDSPNRARIVQLLGMIRPEEPNRQRIIHDAVEWSAKEGDVPYGDPELHHSIGVLLASEDDVYNAEKHLLLGTKSSPAVLAKLLYDYFQEDSPHTAGHYISRAVLPYLSLSNLRDARAALDTFIALLTQSGATGASGGSASSASWSSEGGNIPPHSEIEGVVIFPSLPHVNFLSLLCVACTRGVPEFYLSLKKQYAHALEEVPWNDLLSKIGEVWFDIKIPRQGNMMADLLGSLFKPGP